MPATAVPLLVANFTDAAPLEPPARVTLSVTDPAVCATVAVDADIATLPVDAPAPAPVIVTTALAGEPALAPVAFDRVTEKVFEPLNGAVLTGTAKVFAVASAAAQDNVPLAAV